ncbi:MAG: Holliday junction branch migration protein RuvA [Actinobacteria bacterium]|nr:Holliday junction branch migration protein RuvA [Actinomycetota bacterium]
MLRGRVADRSATSVVVDVQGIGYLVHLTDASRIPPRGEPVELYTSLQVREDAMTLYGFADREARDLFEVLLSASGVGPKLALAALATHPADALRRAVADGDVDVLTLIPGIGRKSAQKLVLELRDKLGGDATAELPGADVAPTAVGEVREALQSLGYAPAEIHAAVAGLDAEGDPAELLRQALRTVGGTGIGVAS